MPALIPQITMKKQALAALLNGRRYGEEITLEEARQARDSRLVVVFGYSDDLVEFRGAIFNERSAPGEAYIEPGRLLPEHERDCQCEYCGYERAKRLALPVLSIWSKEGYSWWIELGDTKELSATGIEVSPFDIMEDGETYCRGIVIDLNDVWPF